MNLNKIRNAAITALLSMPVSICVAQPCANGISTNPENPVNNQFVQMANNFFPGNGTDTHNPWLNQFDWYFGNNTIQLYPNQVNWTHDFSNSNDTINMQHPYGGGMPSEFQYLRPDSVHPTLRDFRWEDGWELLYMNLGYYPDLRPINAPATGSYYHNHNQLYDPMPSNIPYFAIYNRYRGLLRLFANVWYPVGSNYSNINVTLEFTPQSGVGEKLTGLLRHASAYDVALSEPTTISSVHSPRRHGINPNNTQWIVADFQVGYDPCSCQSLGELRLVFTAFNTLNVDIIGRSISLDVPINNSNYTTRNFMNLSDINVDSYVPGTEIYQNMNALAEDYRRRQTKYLNDLNTYNQLAPLRFAIEVVGIREVGKFLSQGITNITLTDTLYTWLTLPAIGGIGLPPATLKVLPQGVVSGPLLQVPDTVIIKAFTDKAKQEIGRVFGNLAAEIFKAASPGKPVAPTVPVATLEESVYKGTITGIDTVYSSALLIPGSLPNAYPAGTTLEPHRVPAYNEVLGKVALLNTPKPLIHSEITTDSSSELHEWGIAREINLRIDDNLHFVLNPALDFDQGRCATSAMLEVEFQEGNFYNIPHFEPHLEAFDTLYLQTNLHFSGQRPHPIHNDLILSNYSSEWYPMDELLNVVFHLSDYLQIPYGGMNMSEVNFLTPDLHSIKLKVMHDFYFNQIGTSGERINTLDILTYQLFTKGGVNHLQDDGPWANGLSGYFDLYIPGLITLGNETITTAHPHVHHVDGNEIVINAQEVLINGPLQVQPGYIVVIQALEKIRQAPGAAINPKIRMRIKKDFYDTPIFEYVNDSIIASFCTGNAYQANYASRPLRERLEQEMAAQAVVEKSKTNQSTTTTLSLYPNPARSELTVQSQGAGIDRLHIYDTSGRPVLQATPGGQTLHRLDIGALAPGVYIVRATCGDEVLTEKLVVAR